MSNGILCVICIDIVISRLLNVEVDSRFRECIGDHGGNIFIGTINRFGVAEGRKENDEEECYQGKGSDKIEDGSRKDRGNALRRMITCIDFLHSRPSRL